MQRKETGSTPALTTTALANPGGGMPLPAATRQFFSRAMGYDFSGVSIHTGAAADKAAKAIQAKAYTAGNRIVFAEGEYQAGTEEGRRLLAHELTHVVQQDAQHLNRKEAPPDDLEPEGPVSLFSEGIGSKTEDKEAKGGCEGVNIQGTTRANYRNRWTATATMERAEGCTGCRGAQCVTVTGTVNSVFTANPRVTLPRVPGGLSRCEQDAVRAAIQTTLAAHEQDHVDAFNTYVGTESTDYTYTGCRSGLRRYQQSIHDDIEVPRREAANAQSAALDPFNAEIPCDCE